MVKSHFSLGKEQTKKQNKKDFQTCFSKISNILNQKLYVRDALVIVWVLPEDFDFLKLVSSLQILGEHLAKTVEDLCKKNIKWFRENEWNQIKKLFYWIVY